MCGINVIIDPTRQLTEAPIRRMMEATRHRGPDEQGFIKCESNSGTIWMATNRLNVVGGEEGLQPLKKEGATYCYNGELYGEDEQADILTLARHFEQSTLEKANGMFAVATLADGQLTTVRDRYGIKPLYKAQNEDGICLYSSEIAGIAASDLVPLKAHTTAEPVNLLLQFRYSMQGTLWQNIHEVSTLLVAKPNAFSETDFVEPVFEQAVSRQVYQSGPNAVMLSGGLDSAVLLALLAKIKAPHLLAYTIAGPEAEAAQHVAQSLGIKCHVVPLGTSAIFDQWLYHQRYQPIADSAGYLTWLIARQARQDGVKVLFSGAGADELFLGYRRHRVWQVIQGFHHHPITSRLLSTLLKPFNMRVAEAFNRLPHSKADAFMCLTWQVQLMKLSMRHIQPTPAFFDDKEFFDPRNLEIENFLRKDVLAVTDHATMAHGVECRLPYLDNDLVAQALALNPSSNQVYNKQPLRKLYKELFGKEYKGKKTGFGLHAFHQLEGSQYLHNLKSPDHPIYQYLNYQKTQTLLQLAHHHHEKYSILALTAWAEEAHKHS